MSRTHSTRRTIERVAQELDHEFNLLRFAERLGHILSVHQELVHVAGNKAFVIYHEPMWNMVLGERDMIAIDIASWALGFYEKGGGGFLRNLRGDDMKALRLDWDYSGNDDAYFRQLNKEWRAKAYDRLFRPEPTSPPPAKGGPNQADVDGLCDRLEKRFEPLHDDRNQHRAHRYEKGKQTAARLAPTDLASHLTTCQELLADIRCLSSNSQFTAYRYDAKAHENDSDAQDVVSSSVGWGRSSTRARCSVIGRRTTSGGSAARRITRGCTPRTTRAATRRDRLTTGRCEAREAPPALLRDALQRAAAGAVRPEHQA